MRCSINIIVALFLVVLVVAGCDPESQSATERDAETQSKNAESLAQVQPADGMKWSPSRDTANNWGDAWEEEGKPSYVYLFDSVGHKIGYFIFKGLPVSYCASITPGQKIVDVDKVVGGSSVDALAMPAPALDGMYYTNANCDQMYGFDAVSGTYYEFTGGGSFNYLLSDSPMTELEMTPLGEATPEKVQQK